MKPLYERFRPRTLDEVVGQDETVKRLKLIRDRTGFGGRVFWFSGPSGAGKTTMARLIAEDAADAYAIVEIDAARLTVEQLRDFERMCRMKPLGRGWHAFIINEAHNLSARVVSELQTVLEEPHVQNTSLWVFTTTTAGQQRLFDTKFDAQPFLSRAMMFELSLHGHELDFAQRVMEIARAEDLDGRPLCEYVDLIRRCKGNLRQALNAVESGEMLLK
jgi:replication-associated recombination protein RarA